MGRIFEVATRYAQNFRRHAVSARRLRPGAGRRSVCQRKSRYRGASGRAAEARPLRRNRGRRPRPRHRVGPAAVPEAAGLAADGVPGPRTRKALGRYGLRSPLGRRELRLGARGWDVAALQFALAWHGFPSGNFDGVLGSHTDAALRGFQRWAGIEAGRDRRAVHGRCALRRPVAALPAQPRTPAGRRPVGDVFGPRGNRFHAGVDFPAPMRALRSAPREADRVVFAGPSGSGWGNLVVVAHGSGVRTSYAHLSRIDVRVGHARRRRLHRRPRRRDRRGDGPAPSFRGARPRSERRSAGGPLKRHRRGQDAA